MTDPKPGHPHGDAPDATDVIYTTFCNGMCNQAIQAHYTSHQKFKKKHST